MSHMPPSDREPRFLTLADVAEILATSTSQVYALVRSGELRGIQIGGRGQWRVETVELEKFIARMYEQSDASHTDASHTDAAPTEERTP